MRFRIIEELSGLRGNVLDVGCNTGFIISHAEKAAICGLDINPDFIEEARAHLPRGDFCVASIYDIPWKDGHFDAVVLCHVLEIPDSHEGRLALLYEVNRVLKVEGKLLISTPNNDHLFYQKHREIGHGVTRDYLTTLLSLTGFCGEVRGWNSIPSTIHLLPYGILERIPVSWWKYLYCPSRLVSYIPGIYNRLKNDTAGDPRNYRALWGIVTKAEERSSR